MAVFKTKSLLHTNRKLIQSFLQVALNVTNVYLTYGMVLCFARVCRHQLIFLFYLQQLREEFKLLCSSFVRLRASRLLEIIVDAIRINFSGSITYYY